MNWMDVWNWLNENNGGVSAVATVVAALVAALALVSAAADSAKRTRPMLTAELRTAPHNDRAAIFVIRNDGPTPARNVRVRFVPELRTYPDDASHEERTAGAIAYRYLNRTISLINPGQELVNVWYRGPGDNKFPLPMDFEVDISYRQRVLRHHNWIRIDGDVALYENDSISSTSFLGSTREIAKDLKKMRETLDVVKRIAHRTENQMEEEEEKQEALKNTL